MHRPERRHEAASDSSSAIETSDLNGFSSIDIGTADTAPKTVRAQIPAQRIQRLPPRVSFIRYEFLEDANSGAFAGLAAIFHCSCNCSSMRKPNPLGQKRSDFKIRVNAEFRSSE